MCTPLVQIMLVDGEERATSHRYNGMVQCKLIYYYYVTLDRKDAIKHIPGWSGHPLSPITAGRRPTRRTRRCMHLHFVLSVSLITGWTAPFSSVATCSLDFFF